jgi:hypothetical protein
MIEEPTTERFPNMIVEATIERFRGIRQLNVRGLGRVNLIIGKNDCGKTAFMEALELVDASRDAPAILADQQRRRMGTLPPPDIANFERVWNPIFWNHEEGVGSSIKIVRGSGTINELAFRSPTQEGEVIIAPDNELARRENSYLDSHRALLTGNAWTIEFHTRVNGKDESFALAGSAAGLKFPHQFASGSPWIESSANINTNHVHLASTIKQNARETEVLEILREVDDRISSVELLAPDGKTAELFIRLKPGSRPLPLTMMGEGFQRSFEIAIFAIASGWPVFFIDEIDNGLHHSTIEPHWRWLSSISAKRKLQIFATTHSEECIQAACRAFDERNDDGLRVIRLDRHEDRTSVAVYDRSLVRTAVDTGVEIRG